MADFRVIEIINSNTIRVYPAWVYQPKPEDPEVTNDIVKISDFNVDENNSFAKQRLTSLLLNRDVDLINPKQNIYNNTHIVSCNVIIDKTDITYYFPEYKNVLVHS